MADILEKIAKTEGNENEISLGELEKHFDEITKDKENDEEQIAKLVKVFEKNLEKKKYDFEPEKIQQQILEKNKSFTELKNKPDLIKIYQLCQILQGNKDIKIDGKIGQELIADKIKEYTKQGAGIWEDLKYENQKLVAKTAFGDIEMKFEESTPATVNMNLKNVVDARMTSGLSFSSAQISPLVFEGEKISDFFQTIDTVDDVKDFIKEERIVLFDAFVEANPNPDKEDSDTEKITLSEEGIMTIAIKNVDQDASIEKTQDISKMTKDEVLNIINENRAALKEIKTKNETTNAPMKLVMEKTTFTDADMKVIDERVKNNGENQPNSLKKVQEKMDIMVDAISDKVNKKIGKNTTGNVNYYAADDIKMIQLRANVCFGEELPLDGDRGSVFYSTKNTENQSITNTYIYRQEFVTRKDVIDVRPDVFKNIMNIPNLDAILGLLGDNDKQNEVFGKFLDFFLSIRVAGMFFENQIGGESMNGVLNTMVLEELYKDVSVEQYFAGINMKEEVNEKMEEESEQENEKEKDPKVELYNKVIESGCKNMGEYYGSLSKYFMSDIIQKNNVNIEKNRILWEQNEIEKDLAEAKKLQESAKNIEVKKNKNVYRKLSGEKIGSFDLKDRYVSMDSDIFTDYGKANIDVVNKLIEAYQVNKNETILLSVYQYLRKTFTDADIKAILNKETFYGSKEMFKGSNGYYSLSSGFVGPETINYEDYIAKIEKNDEKVKDDFEKSKADPVLDIVSQFEGSDEKRPPEQNMLFSKGYVMSDLVVLSVYPPTADFPRTYNGLRSQNPDFIDYKCYKIYLPFSNTPINIETKNTITLPPKKIGTKKRILMNFTNIIKPSFEFGYAYKDKDGTLIIEDESGKEMKRITKDEQTKAKEQGSTVMSNFLGSREMNKINESFVNFQKDFDPINTFLTQHSEDKLSDDSVLKLHSLADNFIQHKLSSYELSVGRWKEELIRLKSMKTKGGLESSVDLMISKQIKALTDMIDFFALGKGYKSKASEFFNGLMQVESNDTWRERNRKTLIATVASILVAVVAVISTIPSGGSSLALGTMAISAIVGTTAGVLTFKTTHFALEEMKSDITINGHTYKYENKSEIGALIDGKITPGDFLIQLGEEILIGSAITFATMGAGMYLGKGLTQLANGTSRFAGVSKVLLKGINFLKAENVTNRMSDLISSSSKNIIKNNFIKRAGEEVTQEFVEEGAQSGLEKIHPALGFMASLISCTPGKSHTINTSFEKAKINCVNAERVGTIGTHTFSYDANVNQAELDAIHQYYKEQGYSVTYDQSQQKYVLEKKMEGDNLVMAEDGVTPLYDTHRIEMIPSYASEFVCMNSSQFAEFNLKINHDTENELTYDDISKVQAFKVMVESAGAGMVIIDPDGSAKFITGKETIHIKPEAMKTIKSKTTIDSEIIIDSETKTSEINGESIDTETETNNISPENNLTIDEVVDTIATLPDATTINNLLEEYENAKDETTKNKIKEKIRINNLSQKSFKDITLQDRYDMGLKQQREYIKKNELWKDKLLSSEEVNKKKFEDLTVEEFSLLMEKIIEAKGETKLVIEQKPVEEKEVPKIEEIRIIRDKEDHGTEKIEGKGPIIEQDGEFLLKKIKTDSFDFPMKDGKVEYQKTNLDGITQQASLGEITIQQAKECFLNGLSIIADMFKGQNRAVLSSGSLFLNVESYKKLGGDIDIATDVQTFINLVLKKTNGLTELDRLVKAGTIQDLIFTKIDHTKIDITNLTDKEINDYINKGDIRVEFNIKSKDGFLINTEFFPEPQGYGLIQLGTKRTKGNIKEYTINGKKIRTVNEELAGKSYLVNLAHEIENNSLEGLSRGKKIKDSIRINNIFEHMVSLGIREPKHMIGFIEETIFDYKNQPGSDGGMCKYLEDGLLGLEKTKEIFKDITNDYNIVKENSVSRGIETTISFNNFMDRTYGIKKELLDIQKNGQNIPDKVYSEITELQQKINIKDPKSFAYYYELYQLRSNFIKPISNKL